MPDLSAIAAELPWIARLIVGLVGGLLLVAGARWYHRGLALAAFSTGAVGVVAALGWIGSFIPAVGQPMVLLLGAVIGGAAVAGVTRMAHRLALVAIGAVAGLTTGAALAAQVAAVPAWAAAVGLLLGALLMPFLYDQLLKVATPAVGAVAIAWAVGLPENPFLLGGLWAFGTAVQVVGDREPRGRPADSDDDG